MQVARYSENLGRLRLLLTLILSLALTLVPTIPLNPPANASGTLVVHLDASNTSSYPGSGNTWTNLADPTKQYTISNGSFSDNAIVFNGSSTVVNIGSPIASGSSYTIFAEVWDDTGETGARNIVSSLNHVFWINGSTLSGGIGGSYSLVTQANFPQGQWVEVTLTFDDANNTMTLYRDGVQVAQNTSVTSSYTAETTFIGAHTTGSSNVSWWDGKIRQVKIWSEVVAPNETTKTDGPCSITYSNANFTVAAAGNECVATFTASGTLRASSGSPVTTSYIVAVGGGGGGGSDGGSGGSGGQLRYEETSRTHTSDVSVAVGSGGSGGVGTSPAATAGSSSSFGSIVTAAGGNAGVRQGTSNVAAATDVSGSGGTAVSGGFGGAGGGVATSAQVGTAGESLTGDYLGIKPAGGGGGGSNTYNTTTTAGSAGGTNGGGAGAGDTTSAVAGTANTGGGGGGGRSYDQTNGAAGGSGVVKIRFANRLSVTFNTQGGSAISSVTTTTGGTLADPGTPTRDGFTFMGWFTAGSGGTALTFPYTVGQSSDFALYAQWLTTCTPTSTTGTDNGTGETLLTFKSSNQTTTTTCGWTVPTGVESAWVIVAGGGGGGGGASSSVGGGGGGGGAVLSNQSFALVPGSPIRVQIGRGGGAGGERANGSSGTSSLFSSLTANGGAGGGGGGDNTATGQGGAAGGAGGGAGGKGSIVTYLRSNSDSTHSAVSGSSATDFSTGVGNFCLGGGGGGGGGKATYVSLRAYGGGCTSPTLVSGGFGGYSTSSGGPFASGAGVSDTGGGGGGGATNGQAGAIGAAGIVIVQYTSSYTVTYNYDGADGGDNQPSDVFTIGGSALNLPTPTKTSFNFGGWYAESALTTLVGSAGASYSPTSTTTLYAKWVPVGPPTITLSYSDQTVPTLTSNATLNKGGSSGVATYSVLAYGGGDGASGCAVNSSTGVVTATSAGVCRIGVSVASDGLYQAGSGEALATFLKSADTITWTNASVTVRSAAGDDRSVTMTANPGYLANPRTSNIQYTVEIKLGETIKIPFNSPNSQRVGYTSYFKCPSVVGWDQSAMFPFDGSGGSFYYLQAKKVGNCSQNYNALTLPSALYTNTLSPGIEITVVKGDQQPISVVGSTTANFGETVTLDATGGSGIGDRTYTVTGTGCSITTIPLSFGGRTYAALASAELTKTGAGDCDVSVTKAGDSSYEPITSAAFTVTFAKGSQELSFSSAVPSNPVTGTNYTPTATSSAGLPVSITASGTCSASSGVVTFNSTGTCTITASQAGDTNYLAASNVTQVIEVGTRNQTISFAAISDKEFGDPAFRISATSSESALTVAFTSADNTKCTVDGNGIVVLVAAGTCTIHADQAGTTGVVAAASRVTRSFEIFPAGSSAPFITSVSRGLGSLTATLVPPSYTGGATVTRYEVQAFDANGDLVGFNNNCTVATAPAPQKCTVDGLVEGTNYTLRARAHHSGGVGSLSPASAAYAPIGNPDAVRELTALADNTSLTISWLAPLDLGGATFTRYDIFIKLASDNAFPGTASHTINSVSAGSYTFTGLINGESYDVKMVTITSVDTTEVTSNSALVSQVPYTTPNAVRDLTAIELGDDIFISWRYPDFDGGRPVLNYDVDVNSGALSCANVTALYCTVTKGAETTFAMSTTADNLAGAGAAATFTLTLQAPTGGSGGSGSSGGSGGGGFTPAPAPSPTLASPKLDEEFPVIETGSPFIIELNGTNLNLITGVSVGTLTLRFEIISNEKIRVILPSRAVGNLKLVLKYSAGQLEQDIVVRASSDKKVNAGSFNGVVALYAKGYIGQRFSAKVGKDWVIVDTLTEDYVRIIERTDAVGVQIRVRIFIDRRLVNIIDLVTQ